MLGAIFQVIGAIIAVVFLALVGIFVWVVKFEESMFHSKSKKILKSQEEFNRLLGK